jgi:hypothetical protein
VIYERHEARAKDFFARSRDKRFNSEIGLALIQPIASLQRQGWHLRDDRKQIGFGQEA